VACVGLGHFRNGLHGAGAGADHGDALAGKVDQFLGPIMGVARLALEGIGADSTPMAVIKKRVSLRLPSSRLTPAA